MKLAHKPTDATHVSKTGGYTASEMHRREQERLDQVVITVRCALCPSWQFTGPSVEARAAASLHRAELHPDQGAKRRTVKRECKVPGCVKWCKPGSDRCWDHATVKEAAGAERPVEAAVSSTAPTLLERIEAERAAVLGEVARVGESAVTGSAALRVGEPVRSDASPNTDDANDDEEGTTMDCKIDGCDSDASDAPKAGPTARLCATHRAERSAEISRARTGKPRGAQGTTLGGGNGSRPKRPRRKPAARRPARPAPIAANGSHASKAERLLAAASAVDDAEAALTAARVELKQAVEELAA